MAAKGLLLGIDVSTTGAKALLIDEQGAVVAERVHRADRLHAPPALVGAGPARVVGRHGCQHPPCVSRGGCDGRRCVRRRHDRPDARADDARRDNQVLRPAILWNDQRTGAGVRRDHRAARLRPAAGPHRQQDADRLHRAEDPLGAQTRAGRLRPHRAHPAAEGLRAFPADRRVCGRQGRRGRHAALRPEASRLGAGDARRAGHPGRVAAEELRRAGGDRADHGRGCGAHRAAGRHAGDGWRRRSGGGRGGRGSDRAGHRVAGSGHLGRGVCDDRRAVYRAGRPAARLLPFGPRHVASDGRDALGRRIAALVSRHIGAGCLVR